MEHEKEEYEKRPPTIEHRQDDDYESQYPTSIDEDRESPVEEVRVTIPNSDDPLMPCNTFRMWFLGLLWTSIVAFVNQFFYLRQNSIGIGYSLVTLLSLPMGHFMARVLPTHQFNLCGWKFSFNPGPFSLKEHVMIATMVSCNAANAYAVDIVILQKIWYNSEKPFIAGLLLVWTTQITGFGLAGVLHRFLVRPSHMIWPQTLVAASLFRSLHAVNNNGEQDQGRMPRMLYFLLVFSAMFVYHWFPNFIFPTIGMLSWICWINPNNVVLAQLTGSYGLGIGTIALDWAACTYYISPLVTPWFSQVNTLIGFVIITYIIAPWAYYTNLWESKKYPIVTAYLFREDGTYYDKSQILDEQGNFDEAAYLNYGPLRMDSFFALAYGIGFAGLSATVVHVLLYHRKELVERWRSKEEDEDEAEDIHCRLMRAYPEIPHWWYGILFFTMFALSMVTCVVWDYMPWWALLLALGMAMFFVLPIGVVQAITNQQPSLNIITEYVIGYILPGQAIVNVTFKTYGFIVMVQALTFTSDLKLGHYMKIPPRIMFLGQVISAFFATTINLGTATWLINTRPDICTEAGAPFTCRTSRTFYSASVIWGLIGPARMFGNKDGAIYSPVQWGFLIGALLPIIFWVLAKVFKNVYWLQYVHWPVLLASTSYMPPALPYMYSNGLFVGFIFAFLLRRYRYRWWSRYNYLTSAAFDAGVAVSGLVTYFAIQSWEGAMPYWWGNPDPNDPDLNASAWDHCALGGANYYGEL